jgi:hypothetical protein
VRGSFPGGCSGAGRLTHGEQGVAGAEEGDGSGARVSGCCAEELKWRIEWSRAREAREQEIRGSEGVLGPCHDGGEVSAGQRSDRRGARGKGPSGAS